MVSFLLEIERERGLLGFCARERNRVVARPSGLVGSVSAVAVSSASIRLQSTLTFVEGRPQRRKVGAALAYADV